MASDLATATVQLNCDARQRLPEQLVLNLARNTGRDCASKALQSWLWMNRKVKVVDGFTTIMPDTAENQKEYPQPNSMKPRVGFPVIRSLMIFSLAVGAVLEVATAKYAGKQTGETGLLRSNEHAISWRNPTCRLLLCHLLDSRSGLGEGLQHRGRGTSPSQNRLSKGNQIRLIRSDHWL